MNSRFLAIVFVFILVGCGALLTPRPQTPTERPYVIEEVRIRSEGGVVLAGEYTRPRGDGPFTGVVLITGSGPHDRDQNVAGHRTNLVLSDHLTKAGYAVLRFDDRGVNESSGEYATADLHDFAGDAAAAMAWLKAREEIDAERVGYIGTSEGGMIAPVAAQVESANFMIFLAAPVRPLFPDVLVDQSVDLSRQQGARPDEIAMEIEQLTTVTSILRQRQPLSDIRADLDAYLVTQRLTRRERSAVLSLFGTRWAMSYANQNPAEPLREFHGPVLALFADLDRQVFASREAPLMRGYLSHPLSEVRTFEGLNHLFQPTETGSIEEYPFIETTIAPHVLNYISRWMADR
ncbi:MAG: alpha/beta fold hydrolase [Pseudomonadota bacterium]